MPRLAFAPGVWYTASNLWKRGIRLCSVFATTTAPGRTRRYWTRCAGPTGSADDAGVFAAMEDGGFGPADIVGDTMAQERLLDELLALQVSNFA